MKCPLCQSTSKFAFEVKGYRLNDCEVCGHRFTAMVMNEGQLKDIYNDNYFHGGGAGYPNYLQQAAILKQRGSAFAKILQKHNIKGGYMLDVGAAAGFLSKGFEVEGWRCIGIEPNAEMAKFGREQTLIDIRQATLEAFETSEKFDLISMIQVVAHFCEPKNAIEKAKVLLKPSGHLLIESWDRNAISARIFSKNWHEYSPPSVMQFFSKSGLSQFLAGNGFEIISSGRLSKKISGAHAKSLLRYRYGDNALIDLLPDKLNFLYPADDLFWALYRKS
jgi:2-polyprenyl-3-methyl-5-hydroxy-6-metoxy-1,4-benzoquinol methylase